jgi:nucleotide-binding universal stress UspA family protein
MVDRLSTFSFQPIRGTCKPWRINQTSLRLLDYSNGIESCIILFVTEQSYQQALKDFRRARQEAAMNQLMHRVTGQADQLLAYHDIADKLEILETVDRGLQEIPLDAIVGSVGRAEDFTREFLPKRDSDAERWARVKSAVLDMKGWLPIDVYKLGEAYFVIDGNHRISVARQLGNETISANVTEVKTKLDVDLDADPSTIIDKANYAKFLEKTGLKDSRPDADLCLTFSDQYPALLAQIESFQRRMTCKEAGKVSIEEAAACWYDEVYMPTLSIIREQGILRNFSDRTEADIYVLLSEKREELEEGLGWDVSPRSAIATLPPARERRLGRTITQLGSKLRDRMIPEVEKGPPPGEWRRQVGATPRDEALFADILVSLQGTEADWRLLDKTISVARRENGRILAIHAVDKQEEIEGEKALAIRETFYQRCVESGIKGQFAAEAGVEGNIMLRRAAWVDLVATNLTFATEKAVLPGLSSEVEAMIKRCPRPILVLADEEQSAMDNALLAYDGSPKADEALFVATYLVLRWQIQLSVVTVRTDHTSPAALERARLYLAGQQVTNARFILRDQPITEAILNTSEAVKSNLLILGGFGIRPVRQLRLGSTVSEVLFATYQPILICR